MTDKVHGMPGPGGSIGGCGVCGGSFMTEIILGQQVHRIEIPGLDGDICVHHRCMDDLEIAKERGWESLPSGPLRDAYERAAAEVVAQHQHVCGECFCQRCGDCLICYAEDECFGTDGEAAEGGHGGCSGVEAT